MSLTGTPFFLTTIALVVVALVLPLALWSRVGGPRPVRFLARLCMLLFAQVTALTMVFVVVNNSNGLFDTWDDLLGTGDHVRTAVDLGPDGTGGKNADAEPKVVQKFTPASDRRMGPGVQETKLKGRISGVEGEVYVWLPPQYDDPAYKDRKFPVVEVLPGFPGSAKAWFGTLEVNTQLKPMMEKGEVAPFIVVAPRTTLLGDVDTGCANIPGKVNADTWLSVDVRKMVTDNFRAEEKAAGWAVAGYSAGAHCAAKLAVAHPDRYHAGVSLSGYNDPVGEPSSLTAKTPELRDEHNPLKILQRAKTPPAVSLFVSGAEGDGYQGGLALKQAAKPPTTVKVHMIPAGAGGHGTAVWKRQVPDVFRWLTQQVKG
ncbi:alpha/beta hydrolase-fold protein [Streptomyces sp. HU2014]|uniref:alpha/beta hydrolase n=1 Tax=Streptomyces sp. HU2014 TaxID=2939414 RepID=UPI0020109312|nr:alpha/beta hydrolase-fold protein [Streptomyces sp. HU2014]UQI48313.1 alpha/beta hydrolase-fold protein [Streptomyces sp. HU2014]